MRRRSGRTGLKSGAEPPISRDQLERDLQPASVMPVEQIVATIILCELPEEFRHSPPPRVLLEPEGAWRSAELHRPFPSGPNDAL